MEEGEKKTKVIEKEVEHMQPDGSVKVLRYRYWWE
jgi:hypothetical protein